MEADLQRIYGVDYRDRWRVDPATGRPVLTLRRLAVLLMRGLPETSALMASHVGARPWSRTEVLLDDLRIRMDAQLGVKNLEPHPDRVRQSKAAGDVDQRAELFRRRKQRRNRRLGV